MNGKNVEDIPSATALFAALHRTLAYKKYRDDKIGADNLAELFLPAHYRFFLRFGKIRENTNKRLARFMPGMTEYIIARTAFFDGLFVDGLEDRIPQIVLLGAGYDSRAYRFAKSNRATKIIELDASPTQKRKLKCLRSAHIDIPNEIKYVPINFTKESLGDVLERAGYKNQEKTFFIWEGVTYYLKHNSVKRTLDFINQSSHRDSVIAFDYSVTMTEQNLNTFYGASEFIKSMREHHANEAFLFSIKEGGIESFLAECDYKMIMHLDNTQIEQKYLTLKNGSLIGKMSGNFRFVCATPNKP